MTIIDLYTQRVTNLTNRISKIRTDVSAAQLVLNTRKEKLSLWIKRVEHIAAKIKKTEASLQTAETVADLEAIAIQLRELRVHQRVSIGRMQDCQIAVKQYDASLASLVKNLESNNSDLKLTKENLLSATEQHEKRLEWFAKLSASPFDTVKAEAEAVLVDINAAITKLNTDTDSDFMNVVKTRVSNYWVQLDALVNSSETITNSWTANLISQQGLSAKIDNKKQALDISMNTLGSFLANSKSTIQSANNKARKILDEALLSTAQKERFDVLVTEANDGAKDINDDIFDPEIDMREKEHNLLMRNHELQIARATVRQTKPYISEADLNNEASVKEILDGSDGKDSPSDMQTAFDDAITATGLPLYDDVLVKERLLDEAKTLRDQEVNAFLLATPDGDPELDANIITLNNNVATALLNLNSATRDLQDTAWYKMEEFEVLIPNSSWQDILNLLKAERDVTRLISVASTNLEDAVITADAELATALTENLLLSDGYDEIEEVTQGLNHSANQILARSSDTIFAAVRGLV